LRKLGREPIGFGFSSPSQIFDEMASMWPNIAGIRYERLDKGGGIQWPCTAPDHPGTRFMYEKDFPRGKGLFVSVEQGPRADELPDKRYSLILNTGRVLYHWHGGTITTRVDGLLQLAPELEVSMNPADAGRFGIEDGETVRVRSRRGELIAVARLTDGMRLGEVFVPFVKLQKSAANFLTNSAYDPDSKIPEYKVCAVRVEKLSEVSGREKMAARARTREQFR
jgi:predicted molibdopterin-dependent oxidoreductase YjgC